MQRLWSLPGREEVTRLQNRIFSEPGVFNGGNRAMTTGLVHVPGSTKVNNLDSFLLLFEHDV